MLKNNNSTISSLLDELRKQNEQLLDEIKRLKNNTNNINTIDSVLLDEIKKQNLFLVQEND